MRTVAAALLVALAATPAAACPTGATCLAGRPVRAAVETPSHDRVTATARAVVRVALAEPAAAPSPLGVSLATYLPARPDAVEVPAFWRVLAAEVYDRLPRVAQQEREFTMVLSPVVVRSPTDSVPGLGLSGDF